MKLFYGFIWHHVWQIHLYPFQGSSLHSFESKANEVKRIERLFLLPLIEKNGSGNNNKKY